MRTSILLAALCLTFAACATDTETTGSLPGPTVSKTLCPTGCSSDIEDTLGQDQWIQVADGAYLQERDLELADDPCAYLPADGVCANACTPEVLTAEIPAGTCAAFRCSLTNGGVLIAGGCN